jgi:HTH-type transcriptional regulator/antitoxin HigA
MLVCPYSDSKLTECEQRLRQLAAFPQEARNVAEAFNRFGIRFVVVEPLAGCKIDGATMWLDDQSPVIGVSLRFDRMDSFWFTVLHEFVHVKNGDALSVDSNLVGAEAFVTDLSLIEQRANTGASNILIPADKLESFIHRVSPLYSRDRINQFASRMKIHPSIVVGQLQHRAELGYHAMKEVTMTKIRDAVVATAVTDGWGQIIG